MASWEDPEEMRQVSVAIAVELLAGKRVARSDVWSIPSRVWMTEFVSTVGGDEQSGRWTPDHLRLDFRPTPVQTLALSVLRDGEDEATVAALLDEAMSLYKVRDEPVTDEWCKANGWEEMFPTLGAERKLWYSPEGCGACLWYDRNEYGVHVNDNHGTHMVGQNPTVCQIVRLCNALNIPWCKVSTLEV